MTLLNPLDAATAGASPTPREASVGEATIERLYDRLVVRTEDMPPLEVTSHVSVPAAESTPLRLADETAVRDAVGRFAAATLLPATAADETREQVRANWAAAVNVVEVATHPEWMLAYVPGSHVGDALVHAIHLTTGHVFGGDAGETVQQRGESTHAWLDRLTRDFESHAAAYSLAYVDYPDHA